MTENRSIPIADILDQHRLRPVDEAWAAALAESINDHGLEQPIVVRPVADGATPYVLVAGGHRMAAFRLLQRREIPAIVREMSVDEARLVEIDENLMRCELNPLDRAVSLAERKAVWERMHPETKHGGDRKSRKTQGENQVANIATRFSKDVAERTGLSERSVQLACRISEEIGRDGIEKLRGTPLAGNQAQLLLLAKMSPAEREAAIGAAVAAKASTVSAALRSVGLGAPEVDPAEKQFRSLCEQWDRAGAKARKRFLSHIGMGDDDVDETAAA